MNNRLKEVRVMQGLSMRAFAARIGISSAAVAHLESGENNPSEQTIRAICSEFNVNRTWLETGEGEMYVTRPFLPELLDALRKYPALKAVMESAVDLMTPADWEALNDFAQRWVDQHKKTTE